MSDLISRTQAIDILDAFEVKIENGEPFAYSWARMRITELPSAQPEIIRCKDCKHFGVDRYNKLTWCSRINYGYGYQADDFCSKAERKTNGCN